MNALSGFKNNKDADKTLAIPVISGSGEALGTLRCLDMCALNEREIIQRLTIWRNENKSAFLTQFQATEERTKSWLANVVIPAESKILFLIVDRDQKLIGNIGLANVVGVEAEIDNVLRGEVSSVRGIMAFSAAALMSWARSNGIEHFYLNVFSDNAKAISLYETLGFQSTSKRKLSVISDGGETRYLIDSDEGTPARCDYSKMEMVKPASA